MTFDKKKIYIISIAIFVALLVALFIPFGTGRIVGAIVLIPATIIASMFIKKRNTLSINTNQIIMIMTVMGIVYVTLYYLSALHFGFTKTGYGLKVDIIFRLTIPIAIIIVSTEIVRYVLQAQKNKIVSVFAYLICLVSDVLICSNIADITNISTFIHQNQTPIFVYCKSIYVTINKSPRPFFIQCDFFTIGICSCLIINNSKPHHQLSPTISFIVFTPFLSNKHRQGCSYFLLLVLCNPQKVVHLTVYLCTYR